jgi:hypothetical protein
MALEYRTSVTTTIDPNGVILLRFLTEIWNDGERVRAGTIWRATLAPGDPIPEVFTIPGVGDVPAPPELNQYVAVAHTPERIASYGARPVDIVIPQQPQRTRQDDK